MRVYIWERNGQDRTKQKTALIYGSGGQCGLSLAAFIERQKVSSKVGKLAAVVDLWRQMLWVAISFPSFFIVDPYRVSEDTECWFQLLRL